MEKLVDAKVLIDLLFEEQSKPTVHAIYQWANNRIIPSYKVGRLTFFYVSEVKEQLARRGKVKVR